MFCPYCQHPAFETAVECPSCGLSLEKADRFFGTVPRLQFPISDMAGVFSRRQSKAISQRLDRFHRQFPQIRLCLVSVKLEPDMPLAVYSFWIFNRGRIWQESERAARNRNILFAIDPKLQLANLMVGYGLEPFIGQHHLESCLRKGVDAFRGRRFGEGCLAVLDSLSGTLESISSLINKTYGVEIQEIYRQESEASASPVPAGTY